jgi:AraC family transcriptional regulator, regulatory protein of adaptative response / methylated-DNA-[protein]-cysteine methyltransferase
VIGQPSALRNQIAIVIPCHRVISSDGYGGGLWRKRWLIEHERQLSPAPTHGLLMGR